MILEFIDVGFILLELHGEGVAYFLFILVDETLIEVEFLQLTLFGFLHLQYNLLVFALRDDLEVLRDEVQVDGPHTTNLPLQLFHHYEGLFHLLLLDECATFVEGLDLEESLLSALQQSLHFGLRVAYHLFILLHGGIDLLQIYITQTYPRQ